MTGSLTNKTRLAMLRLRARMRRFQRDVRAVVAVEMAYILPIFAMMAFLTWDAGSIYTQFTRSTSNLYSMGDIISTRTEDVTCDQLDAISQLVYESYIHGNWARRGSGGAESFTANGAPDFRFILRMINVELQPNGSLRGRVEWEYRRQQGRVGRAGRLVDVPNEMQIEGMRYLDLQGNVRVAPAMNYLGIFDYDPAANRTYLNVDIDHMFPLRFVPNVSLIEKPGDLYNNKCNIERP